MLLISFPGQMEASLSPVSKTNNDLTVSLKIGTKIIDPTMYKHSKHAWCGKQEIFT